MAFLPSVRVPRMLVVLVLTLALAVPVAAAVGGRQLDRAEAAEPQVPRVLDAVKDAKRDATRDGDSKGYTPKQGVKVNDPRRRDKRKILDHIIRSIRNTGHRQEIRAFSWNIASTGFVRSLLHANSRGVTVRVLMSKGKAMEQPRDGDFWRLRRGLRNRSENHPQAKGERSWARYCDRSCRGRRGIAHSKFFIFSKVRKAHWVTMSTSANATENSVNVQWNDIYTNVGSERIYRAYLRTFKEAEQDQPARPGYRITKGDTISAYFYPWKGERARGDRVINELRRISCRGTRDGAGVDGRTRIRIAQDAIIDERGVDIARKVRRLWEQGCNIRIVYALMGKQVLRVLRHTDRGPVPIQQIVNDYDYDGIYDRYLHAKVMTVNGRYNDDRSARVAWQGSENWSGLAKLSDEQGFKIRRRAAERKYAGWVDYLFNNPPEAFRSREAAARASAPGVDPYALIKEELGMEPGTPTP